MTNAVSIKMGNAVKALAQRGDQILVLERPDDKGLWYTLPGGNVKPGETLIEALHRTSTLRLGSDVTVRELRFVREYIADRHPYFAEFTKGTHQVDFIFGCEIAADYNPPKAPPEQYVLTVKWMPVRELGSLRLYPSGLIATLAGERAPVVPHYLGDMS